MSEELILANRLNEEGKLYGMKMNVKKAKTVVVSRKAWTPKVNITCNGHPVEQVTRPVYTGYLITENGKCEEISRRIEIARKAFKRYV